MSALVPCYHIATCVVEEMTSAEPYTRGRLPKTF